MKQLLLILAVLLTSCSCLLSQVPPQTLYVDQNCEGRIPDYRLIVIASDNCAGLTLEQTPVPGTVLDVGNPGATVEIIATDAFGNKSNKLTIPVVLIDTIAPILEWPAGPIAMTDQQLIDVYKVWEAGVKVKGIADWIYDQTWTQGYAFADTARILASLKTFTHAITLTDEEYEQFVIYKESH